MSDLLDERTAEGIALALVDEDTATCSTCGEEIDVSEANDPMKVVVTLENHRQQHPDYTTESDGDR